MTAVAQIRPPRQSGNPQQLSRCVAVKQIYTHHTLKCSKRVLLVSPGVCHSSDDMARPDERAAIEAFMGETKKIDEHKHALAVVTLEAGNPLTLVGLSVKHVQQIRRKFATIGVEAFKDKRHNNAPVLLTKAQLNEVLNT